MTPIDRIEKTFFSACRHWGCLMNTFCECGAIKAMRSGINSADLNMVWSETPLVPQEDISLKKIKAHYTAANLPFWFWVFPSSKTATTLDTLKTAGLSFITSMPCLLLDLQFFPQVQTHTRQLTIRRVASSQDLALWNAVVFEGFDFLPDDRAQLETFTKTFDFSADSPQHLLLAFADSRALGASLIFFAGETAGIYFLTTLPAYRHKGIGLELTQATLRHARSAKARFAALESSPEGLHVYERAGFKEYCRVDIYGL